jgi:hypothetical protein
MRSPSPQYALKKVLAQQLDWHGARVSFLAHFIIALFQVKTVNLAELATAFNGRVKPESNYKRLQRFLRGFELNFEPLARLVVSLMPLDGGRWYLTLDRTNWRFGHHEINILMLGIAYRGVAVPVMWPLLSKAGNSNTAERIALIERFVSVFGREPIAALLADREFVGRAWFEYLQRQGIAFRIRIKHNTLVPNRWNKLFPVRMLLGPLKPGEQRVLAGRRPVWGCFLHIVALGLDDGQLLILVTTDRPEQAVSDYARRWEIETLFGCLKSRGFRFEDTHLTHPERISKLIALLALAFVWAYRVGEIHSQSQPIPFKKLSSDPSSRCSATASIESASSCSILPTNAGLFSAS